MTGPFEIVPMEAEHLKKVGTLEAISFYDAWSESMISGSLGRGLCYSAFTETGELAGYLITSSVFDEGEILRIAVHPSYKRHGLATSLLNLLLEEGSKIGIHHWFLEVNAGNRSAIRLYEKIGFILMGRRKSYYSTPGGKEDALTMHLHRN